MAMIIFLVFFSFLGNPVLCRAARGSVNTNHERTFAFHPTFQNPPHPVNPALAGRGPVNGGAEKEQGS